MKPLIITGCSRSGTNWISAALTRAGLPCTHEKVFRMPAPNVATEVVESSWLAAPRLSQLGAVVGVQVRHPQRVLGSLLKTRSFSADNERGKVATRYARWIIGLYPDIYGRTELDRINNFWWKMNTVAMEHAVSWWRLEDDHLIKAKEVRELIIRSGRDEIPAWELEQAMRLTEPTNRKPELGKSKPVEWDQLTPKVQELAWQLGYAPMETD